MKIIMETKYNAKAATYKKTGYCCKFRMLKN